MTVAPQLLQSARTGGTDVHCTPADVLDRVRRIAPIALDPCTEPHNPCGADRFYTERDNGLIQPWMSLTYCNFPYSGAKSWAAKMATEAALGVAIVALVAARPDTRWWRTLWDASDVMCFWRGRLTFGDAKSPAPFPSALFGLNVSQRRFRQAFGDAAEVVVPT